MNLNKVILFGHLTRDPELKALASGSQVVSFALATNHSYKSNDGQKKESVEFHNVIGFGKVAELIAQYCKKGDGLYVEGRLQTRSWEKDAQKKYRTEVVIETFQFGGQAKREEKKVERVAPASSGVEYPDEEINPEDIPF